MRSVIILLLLSSVVVAQQAPQVDVNDLIAIIEQQRNRAATEQAYFEARTRALEKVIADLKKKIDELENKSAEPSK